MSHAGPDNRGTGSIFGRIVEDQRHALIRSSAFSCVQGISAGSQTRNYSDAKRAIQKTEGFFDAFDSSTPVFEGFTSASIDCFHARLTPSESALLESLLTGRSAGAVVPVKRVSPDLVLAIGKSSDRKANLVDFILRRKQIRPDMRALASEAAMRLPDHVLLGYGNRLLEESGYILDSRNWSCLSLHGKLESGALPGMRTYLVSGLAGCGGYYDASALTCIRVDRWAAELPPRLAVHATINPVMIHETAHWIDDHLGIAYAWQTEDVEYNAMLLALLFSGRFFTKSDLDHLKEPYASAGKQIVAGLSAAANLNPARILKLGNTHLSWIHDRVEDLLHKRYCQMAPLSSEAYNDLLRSRCGINDSIGKCRKIFHSIAAAEGIFLDLPSDWFHSDYRPPPGAGGVALRNNNLQQIQAAALTRISHK